MAAMEPQSCFRVLPSEPMHDPPFHGTPAGQVNMTPRNALPIRYINEILLKVALNTINLDLKLKYTCAVYIVYAFADTNM
jgi:hypothetical protein